MKKLIPLLLATLFLVSVAGAEEALLPTFPWERDPASHWQLDASGSAINQGAHTVDMALRCTVCGCEVLDWGEGMVDLTDYDPYGNILRMTSYEGDVITYESVHILTCNDDGMVLIDVEYVNGVLTSETIYTAGEQGEQIPVAQTFWQDDGTLSINEYDQHGNCISSTILDTDGTVLFVTISEYALDDEGWYYECRSTSSFDTGDTFMTESNQYGDPTRSLNTFADGTVWGDWTYEYEYFNGTKLLSRQYSFGVLVCEEHYDYEGNLVEEITYEEDGSTIVQLYNELGDPTSATACAADGSVVSVTTYEYVYSEYNEQMEIHVYVDGVLTSEIYYHLDEEAGITGSTEIVYNADGTRTVCEYGDWLELLSTTVYAADGTVINTEIPDPLY